MRSAEGSTEKEVTKPDGTQGSFRQEMAHKVGQRMTNCLPVGREKVGFKAGKLHVQRHGGTTLKSWQH